MSRDDAEYLDRVGGKSTSASTRTETGLRQRTKSDGVGGRERRLSSWANRASGALQPSLVARSFERYRQNSGRGKQRGKFAGATPRGSGKTANRRRDEPNGRSARRGRSHQHCWEQRPRPSPDAAEQSRFRGGFAVRGDRRIREMKLKNKATGENLRPTLGVVDDPQIDESARSDEQIKTRSPTTSSRRSSICRARARKSPSFALARLSNEKPPPGGFERDAREKQALKCFSEKKRKLLGRKVSAQVGKKSLKWITTGNRVRCQKNRASS